MKKIVHTHSVWWKFNGSGYNYPPRLYKSEKAALMAQKDLSKEYPYMIFTVSLIGTKPSI